MNPATSLWQAFVRIRAIAIATQAADRVEYAMTATAWLRRAQIWAMRHGDSQLADWLGAKLVSCLLHKWAA